MKYYDGEYERYVDEEEIKRQYKYFQNFFGSWWKKSYEQFRDENFFIMRYSDEEEEE